jgi:hypothetical protein
MRTSCEGGPLGAWETGFLAESGRAQPLARAGRGDLD